MKQQQLFSNHFPLQPFYFVGIHVMGPNPAIARKRYSFHKCIVSAWNHRLEKEATFENHNLDCCELAKIYPFVYENGVISNGLNQLSVFPQKASIYSMSSYYIPLKQRNKWKPLLELLGQNLTAQVPFLDTVEVENSISPADDPLCSARDGTKTIKVVEFNADRGTRRLEIVDLLRDVDIIILNEMDFGMARSGQQHTTRLLAHMLGMHYAWGLEFVELTNGAKDERETTTGIPNFYGLHGNAFLTRCKISDPVIFRDKVGKYFSDKKMCFNANGFEKRLGGRMGMFARINVAGESLVIGSTHKLEGFHSEIKSYIGSSKAITAGDQNREFCDWVGLSAVENTTSVQ
jgi:hypothetical protein